MTQKKTQQKYSDDVSGKSPSKLWSGRFSEPTDKLVETFTASVGFDWRLYRHDIAGSIAHARMLAHVGVLTQGECDAIVSGLTQIQTEIDTGAFAWSVAFEDVHMNIEARLIDRLGDVGKKLHTGRSRNDQVATDVRLYVRDGIDALSAAIRDVQQVIVDLAEREAATVMPGFTHMQTAQPVTFGHPAPATRSIALTRPSCSVSTAPRRIPWTRCPTAISLSNSSRPARC